jgi:hypothetical protein
MEYLMVGLGIMAFVSMGYYFSIAFRLDWVRYIEEPLYVRVGSLSCPNQPVETVVVLSEEKDASPKYTLRYSYPLARYLDSAPAAQPVTVSIRRVGYLWEFSYAAQLLVVSIETQGIDSGWRKAPEDLVDCTYGPQPLESREGFEQGDESLSRGHRALDNRR